MFPVNRHRAHVDDKSSATKRLQSEAERPRASPYVHKKVRTSTGLSLSRFSYRFELRLRFVSGTIMGDERGRRAEETRWRGGEMELGGFIARCCWKRFKSHTLQTRLAEE